jgi:hypothetical protein
MDQELSRWTVVGNSSLPVDGVRAEFIRRRSTPRQQRRRGILSLPTESGFLIAKRQKGWTFYRRNEQLIRHSRKQLRPAFLEAGNGSPLHAC